VEVIRKNREVDHVKPAISGLSNRLAQHFKDIFAPEAGQPMCQLDRHVNRMAFVETRPANMRLKSRAVGAASTLAATTVLCGNWER
jgi:hypothetical protein